VRLFEGSRATVPSSKSIGVQVPCSRILFEADMSLPFAPKGPFVEVVRFWCVFLLITFPEASIFGSLFTSS